MSNEKTCHVLIFAICPVCSKLIFLCMCVCVCVCVLACFRAEGSVQARTLRLHVRCRFAGGDPLKTRLPRCISQSERQSLPGTALLRARVSEWSSPLLSLSDLWPFTSVLICVDLCAVCQPALCFVNLCSSLSRLLLLLFMADWDPVFCVFGVWSRSGLRSGSGGGLSRQNGREMKGYGKDMESNGIQIKIELISVRWSHDLWVQVWGHSFSRTRMKQTWPTPLSLSLSLFSSVTPSAWSYTSLMSINNQYSITLTKDSKLRITHGHNNPLKPNSTFQLWPHGTPPH